MRDWDIRVALCNHLRGLHADEVNTLLIEEMGVCQGEARIDVAVLNGVAAGYEIKSPSDTLSRLPHQRDAYNKVFDYVTIVTSSKYLEAIDQLIPSWWGLMQAQQDDCGNVVLIGSRQAQRNDDLDPHALAQLLWKEEVLAILDEYGAAKGLKSKARKYAWARLVEIIPMPELADVVREQLKARTAWQGRQSLTGLPAQART